MPKIFFFCRYKVFDRNVPFFVSDDFHTFSIYIHLGSLKETLQQKYIDNHPNTEMNVVVVVDEAYTKMLTTSSKAHEVYEMVFYRHFE